LTKKKNHLLEKEAIMILQDMIKGLKEMVKNGFVHRDLKPENTFIHDNIYKIADFGFCQQWILNKTVYNILMPLILVSCQEVFYKAVSRWMKKKDFLGIKYFNDN